MSCSICLLPFTPGPTSTAPNPPPPGILSDRLYNYFRFATGIGCKMGGVVSPFEYLDGNCFRNIRTNLVIMMQVWEAQGGTEKMCHTVCAALLRHVLKQEEDTIEALANLAEIESVIGRALDGPRAGRLPHVRYEDATSEKIDLAPFWIKGTSEGGNKFDWEALKPKGLEWMLSRPDMFPKFHKTVSKKRLSSIGEPSVPTTDILTSQPTDIFLVLLPYFSTPSYLALTSTCRLLRRHALTTFQPEARKRVHELGWAIPLKAEYNSAGENKDVMAHEGEDNYDADWMLYLSHVHRTPSMRMRRRIWELCQEIKRVFDEKRPESEYADVIGENGESMKSQERIKLETQVESMNWMTQMMNVMGPRS